MELVLLLCFVATCSKGMCIKCCREVERFKFGVWSTTTTHEDADDDMNADDDVAMVECTGVALVDDGAATVISFPKSEKAVVFSHGCEVVAAANTSYLQPAVKNYQSVDAIIKPDIMFQVTGAHRHPCKQKGLHDVLKLL
ncbi:hypothetical protein Plhal703r1_c09g0048521 [Plasmopara halstedii]